MNNQVEVTLEEVNDTNEKTNTHVDQQHSPQEEQMDNE